MQWLLNYILLIFLFKIKDNADTCYEQQYRSHRYACIQISDL